ncbi:MAG: M4 family metallopeptidase [Bacteroidia bacterium]
MKMHKNNYRACLSLWLLLLCSSTAMAQATKNTESFLNKTLEQIVLPSSDANWIELRTDANINPERFFVDYTAALGLSKDDEMRLYKIKTDNLGFTHYRFNQYYSNARISGAQYIVHVNNEGKTYCANGQYVRGMYQPFSYSLSLKDALQKALVYVGATKYMWEDDFWERDLKEKYNNKDTSYYPKGELIWTKSLSNSSWDAANFKLAYQFDIYAASPHSVKRIEIDANSGEVINDIPLESNCSATTLNTIWNGNRPINTDLYAAPNYRLRNDCQTATVRVRNWNSTTATSNPVEITSSNNSWTNQNQVFGGTVSWEIKGSYNYFLNWHSRNSYNNVNGSVEAYINAVFDDGSGNFYTDNASMTFTGGTMMVGLGSSGTLANSWGTTDIIGHEYTHAVTGSEAALIYSYESGALNESFSDIFGEMAQSDMMGTYDWLLGADRTSGAIRSMSNPNAYGDPDTYLGNNWYSGSGDDGGVHTNSGVQNYWFYLLSIGGSGTNDIGNSFNVTGITIFKAEQIAYRALTEYLVSSSGYSAARTAAVHAARDIYGACSSEAWQTANAWYAVGVGPLPVPQTWSACGNYGASGSQAYAASTTITNCSGGATVVSGVPTSFTANEITLSPGFTATNGCNFVAYVTPCSTGIARNGSGNNSRTLKVTNMIDETADLINTGINLSPNPFNNTFNLKINLIEDANVSVTIYDMMGKEVDRVMENQTKQKGLVQFQYNNEKLPPNIYMCVIEINGKRYTEKIVKL